MTEKLNHIHSHKFTWQTVHRHGIAGTVTEDRQKQQNFLEKGIKMRKV